MSRGHTIACLIEHRRSLVDGVRNRQAQSLFAERSPGIVHDKFRELPLPLAETGGKIPVVLCLDRTLWSQLLGFPLDRFYQDPDFFLEQQLRMDIYHLENLRDDQFFDEFIPVWGGPGFEATLFGMRQKYAPDSEPWLERTPIIERPEDLDRMPRPGFLTLGPMPSMIEFYERLRARLDGSGLTPVLPGWIRGPLGVAQALRGTERLSMDFLLDRGFAQELFQYIVDFRKTWCTLRDHYLGLDHVPGGLIYDDEVQIPMISPRIYREFLLPKEQELHSFHNGLRYWHSCGDATPFMELVAQIPHIDMVHAGPFSSAKEVVNIFGQRSAVELALRAKEDFCEACDDSMKAGIRRAVALFESYNVQAGLIRLTVYENSGLTAQQALDKAQRWISMAQEITRAAM